MRLPTASPQWWREERFGISVEMANQFRHANYACAKRLLYEGGAAAVEAALPRGWS